MSISNERLEELIASVQKEKQNWDFEPKSVRNSDAEYAKIHAYHVALIGDHLRSLQELLAIRQAATAGVDEAAERLYDAVVQVSIGGSYNVPHRLAVPVIKEHLAALVAERDAVLRECREHVQDAVDEQSRGSELLAKIDALTKGGGDGS